MTAAIYARKSTDQSAMADETKSVTRQIDHGTAYATRKGLDGARVVHLRGRWDLRRRVRQPPRLRTAHGGAEAAAAIPDPHQSEESRLGREAIETAYALKQLITAGVRVFFYLENRERTFDSPTDRLLMSVTAFADELERQKAGLRVYDAMSRKARAGHMTGGRVFGYDNHEVLDRKGDRSHVERRIHEAEAAVVRRIFEMSAAGAGLTRITKTLNEDRVPSPRPQQGRVTPAIGGASADSASRY